MRYRKPILTILTLLALNIGICSAFTFDGDFNYQTPSQGIVHFSQDVTASSWDIWGTLTRWQGVQWNTRHRGVFAIDVSNGCTVNVTSMQQQILIYDVVAVGVETQTIYYRGLGRPSDVDGGTYAITGGNVVVTTDGNTTVTVTWSQEMYHEIADQISSYLAIYALVPIVMAAGLLIGLSTNALSWETAVKIIGVTVAVMIITVILGVFMKI